MLNRTVLVISSSLLLFAACGELRDRDPPRPLPKATYVRDIQPVLAKRCVSCHGETDSSGQRKIEGNYDLSRYNALLRGGTDDVPNAIAGDAKSVLLTRLDPATPANAEHWGYFLPGDDELSDGQSAEARRDADWAALKAWIVDAGLRYSSSFAHPPGWAYPTDRSDPTKGFHGAILRARRWNTDECKLCHGDDLRGANGKPTLQFVDAPSCTNCHAGGIDKCTTCHGDDLRSGPNAAAPPRSLSGSLTPDPHTVHLYGGDIPFAVINCNDCHVVPDRVNAPGHLGADLRAEITLSDRAKRNVSSAGYAASTKTCTVSCHGGAFLARGEGITPSWTQKDKIKCGDCHAVGDKGQGQKPHYGGNDCANCHRQGIARCTPTASDKTCIEIVPGTGLRWVDANVHGDGQTPLGNAGAENTCYACHGTAASKGAPAPDVAGNSDISTVSVGLHSKHVTYGIPCQRCHLVPTDVKSPGHIDSDRPAEVTFDIVASGGAYNPPQALDPKWDRKTATCSNVYCHSLNGGKVTEWKWTATKQLACDSCHGAPPAMTLGGRPHPPVAQISQCPACHGSAFRPDGTLDPARHINGRIDR